MKTALTFQESLSRIPLAAPPQPYRLIGFAFLFTLMISQSTASETVGAFQSCQNPGALALDDSRGPYGVQAHARDPAPPSSIKISPGVDIQAILHQAPEGAIFWLEPGVYRLSRAIAPKHRQKFLGAEGVILNGSELVTAFVQVGALWMLPNQTQEGVRTATGESDPNAMRGGFPETVFLNNKPLTPVDALRKLKPGYFYFDYEADQIYIADNPSSQQVEVGKAPSAFSSDARDVTISGFTIEKFNAPIQVGAINGHHNWTITNNIARLNYGIGITAQSGSKIIGNTVHDNGEMGLGGAGDGILVEGNEIYRNGFWSGIDVFWEGGGAKFAVGDGLIVRGNHSHDNKGFGLWTDIDNTNTLYENNLIVNNSGGGITHEISYNAVIRNNILIGNGFADQGGGSRGKPNWLWGSQIQLQNSKDVEVYANKLDMTDSGNGIGLIQQKRGTGKLGPYTTTGNKIYDNDIVLRSGNGRSGGAADFNEAGMLNGGNTWKNNRYHMPDGERWWWGSYGFRLRWAEYSKYTGQDEGSVRDQSYPDTSRWIASARSDICSKIVQP